MTDTPQALIDIAEQAYFAGLYLAQLAREGQLTPIFIAAGLLALLMIWEEGEAAWQERLRERARVARLARRPAYVPTRRRGAEPIELTEADVVAEATA